MKGKVYHKKQVREILIHERYSEILAADKKTLYFQHHDGRFVACLNEDELYLPQIENICDSMKITLDQFEELYRKAKHHKL